MVIICKYYKITNFFFVLFIRSSMQQSYGTTNATAPTYMNTAASTFYNPSSYAYSTLSTSRGLNPACKANTGYLSSPYSSPASPFQSAGHSQAAQYPTYASYGTPSSSSFAQGFTAQVQIIIIIINRFSLHIFNCYMKCVKRIIETTDVNNNK